MVDEVGAAAGTEEHSGIVGGTAGEAGDGVTSHQEGTPAAGTSAEGAEQKGAEGTGEQKGAEGAEQKGTEEGGPEGAPEKYEAFNLPEGVTADSQQLETFNGMMKDLNATQEQAQKLIDFEVARNQQVAAEWAETKVKWLKESKADSEIGGAKFVEKVEMAKKAIKVHGTPAFEKLIESHGLDNHPEMIRLLSRAGENVSEDKIVQGRNTSIAPKSRAERMFAPGVGSMS